MKDKNKNKIRKKIVRIGGTAYSGSTFLDMMIANDHNGFSCGEIVSLFRPNKIHYFNPDCACQNSNCNIWEKVRKKGESQVWYTLAEMFPYVQFFVDSSKNLVWLFDQSCKNNHCNFEVINVLIWKTPAEFAYSCIKRNKTKGWKRHYINYYTRYFHITKAWYSVRYSDLAQDTPRKIRNLCHKIGINYFPGKEEYWNKLHHTLFGSNVAKLHLYERNSEAYNRFKNRLKITNPNLNSISNMETSKYRTFHYNTETFDKIPFYFQKEICNDAKLKAIEKILETTEIDFVGDKARMYSFVDSLRPFPMWYLLSKAKHHFQYLKCKAIIKKNGLGVFNS